MAAGVVFGVTSARPDGATSVALGLAGTYARAGRALLVDLNLQRPEVAPVLDLDERQSLYHLAYAAQLEAVRPSDLEEYVAWHDGLGIVTGLLHETQSEQITDHFRAGLLEASRTSFGHVVLDLGTLGAEVVGAGVDRILWVVTPSARGLAAFERTYRLLEEVAETRALLARVRLVLNRVAPISYREPESLFHRQYGLTVIASIPETPAFWSRVELEHSIRFFTSADMPKEGFVKAYGAEALSARQALERLAAALVDEVEGTPIEALENAR